MSSTRTTNRFHPPGAGWLPSGIDRWASDPQLKIVFYEDADRRSEILFELKTKEYAIEGDRRLHVIDHVSKGSHVLAHTSRDIRVYAVEEERIINSHDSQAVQTALVCDGVCGAQERT